MKAKVYYKPFDGIEPITFTGTVLGPSIVKEGHFRIKGESVVYDVPVGQFELIRDEQ